MRTRSGTCRKLKTSIQLFVCNDYMRVTFKAGSYLYHCVWEVKQKGQCTCNGTLWRVRVIAVGKKTQCVMCVLLSTCHCQQYKNAECCAKVLLWWIYVAGNIETSLDVNVKCSGFVRFWLHWEFLNRLSWKSPIPDFTEIRPVGAALIHEYR